METYIVRLPYGEGGYWPNHAIANLLAFLTNTNWGRSAPDEITFYNTQKEG